MAATEGQSLVLGKRGWSGIFLVEDIERRQADVGDFLLAKISWLCEVGGVFALASVEAHAPPAIERDTTANPNVGKALPRRLPCEEPLRHGSRIEGFAIAYFRRYRKRKGCGTLLTFSVNAAPLNFLGGR